MTLFYVLGMMLIFLSNSLYISFAFFIIFSFFLLLCYFIILITILICLLCFIPSSFVFTSIFFSLQIVFVFFFLAFFCPCILLALHFFLFRHFRCRHIPCRPNLYPFFSISSILFFSSFTFTVLILFVIHH